MSIKEILEQLPKLTPAERQAVRDWLDADEVPETDELVAAVDEGIRSAETEPLLSIEEARETIRRWDQSHHFSPQVTTAPMYSLPVGDYPITT